MTGEFNKDKINAHVQGCW